MKELERKVVMVTKENLNALFHNKSGHIYSASRFDAGWYTAIPKQWNGNWDISYVEAEMSFGVEKGRNQPLYFIEGEELEFPDTDELILMKTMSARIVETMKEVKALEIWECGPFDEPCKNYIELPFPEVGIAFQIFKKTDNGEMTYSANMCDWYNRDFLIYWYKKPAAMIQTRSLSDLAASLEDAVRWRMTECRSTDVYQGNINPAVCVEDCIMEPKSIPAGEVIGSMVFDFSQKKDRFSVYAEDDDSVKTTVIVHTSDDDSGRLMLSVIGGNRVIDTVDITKILQDEWKMDEYPEFPNHEARKIKKTHIIVHREILDFVLKKYGEEVMPSTEVDYESLLSEKGV